MDRSKVPPAGTNRLWVRLARVVVLAILIGIGTSHVLFAIRDWPLGDLDVYLDAARRLRDGEPLYLQATGDATYWDVAVHAYWYAPWYAVLWVPLTYLPREVVAIVWSALLLVSTVGVVSMLGRQGRFGIVLALLVGPPLVAVSAGGNVQSLMLLALLAGIHRRWGPLAVAAAASLKLTPLLLVASYVARREWGKVTATVALTAILLVPGLLLGMTRAGIETTTAPSLLSVSPLLFGGVVLLAIGATFIVPRRHATAAAAAAAVLALPRLFVYDVTLAAVGAAREQGSVTPADQPPAFTHSGS